LKNLGQSLKRLNSLKSINLLYHPLITEKINTDIQKNQ